MNSVKPMIVTPAPFHRVSHSTANPRQLCSIYGSLGLMPGSPFSAVRVERPRTGLGVQADVVLERHVLRAHLDQVHDEVVDLLVVQGALVADAPRRHRVAALLEHLVDVVLGEDRVVRRVAEGPRADVREVRRIGERVTRLDHAAAQLRAVTAHAAHAELVLLAEVLHGELAAVEREREQLLLLAQVLGRLAQPVVGDEDDEERDEHDAPALQLLQQRGLEGGVARAGAHAPRDVERLLLLAAAEVERGSRREHEDRAEHEQDDACGVRGCEHVRGRSSPIRSPRRTGPAVAGRSCRCRVAVRGSPRSCRPPRCRR